MKFELEEKLFKDFPDMFYQTRRGPAQLNLLGNHIYCANGWFDILYNLCKEIYPMRPKVLQIKEKFGILRFSCSFPNDYSKQGWEHIKKAENKSAKTCELCGAFGELRIVNDIRATLCKKCYESEKQDESEISATGKPM